MAWMLKPWRELDRDVLYAILALRQEVFVVEQSCAYLDADGWDAPARHLWHVDPAGAVTAYCRLFPAGARYDEASVGRVVTARSVRRTGLGRELMARALEALDAEHGSRAPVRIHAQAYLERFYGDFGFVRDGENYLEDGVPHLDMVRR